MVRLSRSITIRVLQALMIVSFLAGWELVVRFGQVNPIILTPPTDIVETLFQYRDTIQENLFITYYRVFVAFFFSTIVGIALGWLLSHSAVLMEILDPYLIVSYGIPHIIFYPVFILLVGLGDAPIIFVAISMALLLVLLNTVNGLNSVPDIYREVSRSLGLTRIQAFRHIFLPASVPYLFTGLKLGFIYSSIGVIVSEFIFSDSGLGYLISFNYGSFYTSRMYTAIIVLVLLSISTNGVLRYMESYLYHSRVAE